jgi:nucleoside-diphosphate-sugar epimerase
MNIFVVGGSGFIGTNLVEKLLKNKKNGDSVISVDIRTTPFIDARKVNQLTRFTRNADVVYHLANIPMHRLSMENPYRVIENNYAATLSVAEAVRRSERCKKIVFFSSFAVYGKNNSLPWTEETPLKATTPYGLGKIQSEMLLYAYHKWYGLDVIIIRPSNVFGPYEELHQPLQVVPQWFGDAESGRPLIVYGSKTTRDFTYVDDIVKGAIRASEKNGCKVYNFCSSNPVLLKNLARMISDNVKIVDLPGFETEQWCGSHEKAKKELGFTPTKTIEEWINERKQFLGKKTDA